MGKSSTLLSLLGLIFLAACSQPAPDLEAVIETPEVTETVEASADPEAISSETPSQNPSEAASAEPPAVFADDGIAIAGADPVAYFTQGRYVPGQAAFSYDWGGATWQFSTAEHRDLFIANPAQYAPQYGGFCAWALSQGYTAGIDPNAWKIVDGKLYLNYDQRIQRRWSQDVPGNIAKADQNWPGVLAQSPQRQ
ncbi:hypothetical protein XM38_007240 [Halomicronema hongdechloris C2206]|uniref:YHS domain-containing protein n=1 Tax=Halomicronema hongdechloris C2206 TaxID=1641165 RepID=A0A1Z3HHN4_9CYAN|nr:YHS domain-containing (seleno)protein [Halomicronema hongdechloris]ASC69795.1 hypothetical protein XM38_007240 [Halomicronema hongdechloris C2206]